MTHYEIRTHIKAAPTVVWRILTDASTWKTWNSTIDAIDGQIALGEKVTVKVKINPGRAFPLKVVEFTPPARMVWSDGMPLGLFKGERVYTLTPSGDGTEFFMREAFTGLLAPMITRSIPDMTQAFKDFAADLKAQAER